MKVLRGSSFMIFIEVLLHVVWKTISMIKTFIVISTLMEDKEQQRQSIENRGVELLSGYACAGFVAITTTQMHTTMPDCDSTF